MRKHEFILMPVTEVTLSQFRRQFSHWCVAPGSALLVARLRRAVPQGAKLAHGFFGLACLKESPRKREARLPLPWTRLAAARASRYAAATAP
jgi:hypothetical protein